MYYVDLNSDLGESFGNYTIGMDREILKYVSSANVACGWHAGDPMVMAETVAMAREYKTAVGAHPGFPDLMGFGRRNMNVTPEEAKAYVKYQLGALMAFTGSLGMKIQHVKPHGALYNMAAVDEKLARAMCEAVYEVDKDIIFMGLAGSWMVKAAEETGLKAASEVFADRAYNDDGTLVSRKLPGAVIKDEELAQCMPGHTVRFKRVGIEEAQELYCQWKAELEQLKEKLAGSVEPASELQAVGLAAAVNEDQNYWGDAGTYRVVVNGTEFLVDLRRETERFR